MHYIVGTQIIFSKPKIVPGATSATKIKHKPKEFEYGKLYTLYTIRPMNDTVVYVFRDQQNNTIQKNFESVSQGDKWIAGYKNETMPDYAGFYQSNTS
tara:strand:- start:757 stop:1050 length:294 start_codon:yes stop_codon:yes gene_type:complete